MSQRIAVIDLGSNSARLIVMHVYHNGAYNLVYHQKESVRLSQGLEAESLLQPEAMERALATLHTFAHMCQLFEVDKTLAVATAAVRNARNGQEFVQLVRRETGIPLKAISGESEAKLGFIGALNTLDVQDALLFDLGGASTELTLVRNRRLHSAVSLPIGAVNLTERFQLHQKNSPEQLTTVAQYLADELSALPWLQNVKVPLVGIGGTARTIAKMDQRRKNYPFPKVHNYRMAAMAFDALWEEVAPLPLARRKKVPGLNSDRADIIIAGMAIIKALLTATRSNQLISSGCGVREGLFLQYYLALTEQPDVLPDPLQHSTHNMLLFCNGSREHAYHVAKLADQLWQQLQEPLSLTERDRVLLQVAAALHDIGISINYYNHARHGAYLVENARLFGLSHREQMLAAVIVSWHHGASVKYTHHKLYNEFLDTRDWDTAQKLAILLSLAESLDTTQMGLVSSVNATCQNNELQLRPTAREAIPIECDATLKHAKWIKKALNWDLTLEQA